MIRTTQHESASGLLGLQLNLLTEDVLAEVLRCCEEEENKDLLTIWLRISRSTGGPLNCFLCCWRNISSSIREALKKAWHA